MDNIQPDQLDETLTDSLDLTHSSCYFCNGFYGPNFGEPICGTCHDFLYAEDLELINVLHRPIIPSPVNGSSSVHIEKDDGDSGNDEPSEEGGPIPPVAIAALPVFPDLFDVDGGEDDVNDENLDEEVVGAVGLGLPMRFNPVPVVCKGRGRPTQLPEAARPPAPEINEKLARRLALLTTPASNQIAVSNTDDISLKLPPEIWLTIFLKLDDTSLLMVSKVCTKWKTIVERQFSDSHWEHYVEARWPLVRPIYNVDSWHSVCSDLIDSLPCKPCFLEMNSIPFIDMNERSFRQSRLSREIKWLKSDHPEGIEATPLDDLNYNWLARVNGPPDSPYQGGVFYLNIKILSDYPLMPPAVRFLTRVYHPNVSRHGDVGIDCIQHNWTPSLTIAQVLISVQSLLTDPCTEANMEAGVASLYRTDRTLFDKIARVWTWKYAMHEILLH